MASMNVYLADALKAEMETHEGVNWSQIAQEAIRAELSRRSIMNAATANLGDVVTRLKATPSSYSSGYEAGLAWANADAEARELEDLESLTDDTSNSLEVLQDLVEREWKYNSVTDLIGGRLNERRVQGFIDGAMSVWSSAKKLM